MTQEEHADESSSSKPPLFANIKGVTVYSQHVELPLEAQVEIARLVEEHTRREVEARLQVIVRESVKGFAFPTTSQVEYSNAFYMGAGLSAFAGLLGFAYFGGALGVSVAAAAAGPFLMSVLGLHRLAKRRSNKAV